MTQKNIIKNNNINLKILSLNVAGIPRLISDNDVDGRINRITDQILTEKENIDIVCLQELFDNNSKRDISDKLKLEYPYQINTAKYRLPGLFNIVNWLEDSGLFIASKYPISWYNFVPFKTAKGPDKLAWKGVLGACICLPTDKKVMIFNTHLQSNQDFKGYTDKYNIRYQQIKTIIHFIKEQSFDYSVLVGDFNTSEDNYKEYNNLYYSVSLMDNLGYDIYRTMFPNSKTFPGYTMDGIKNHNMIHSNYQARLDYMFSLGISPDQFKNIQIWYPGELENNLNSDHFGLHCSLSIGKSDSTPKTVKTPFGFWTLKRLFAIDTYIQKKLNK